jgi:uncharacterized protein (DUF697 family)
VTSRSKKIHAIIHGAAALCAGVGGGLAQLPGSDSVAIVPLQASMITAIAIQHGVVLSEAAAADMVLTFAATQGGRLLSQVLIGWIPGYGNVINASTAAALTEAIGWAADAFFTKDTTAPQPEKAGSQTA